MPESTIARDADRLAYRDPQRARALARRLEALVAEIGRERVCVMHVCGTHEQAIAKFGLRAVLPRALDVIMGPGCPVCVTDLPEVDEAVTLAQDGKRVATYGDMVRVPGTTLSLADAAALGARVDVVYSAAQAVALARATRDEVVFFASGFETTAVTTAAVALADVPPNFSILSAHKYIPPAMEVVARLPETRIEAFLAAGHAATITGWGIFEPFVARHRIPVVVAGFEPLDILAALVQAARLIRDGRPEVANMYPRCVTREGNRNAQTRLWRVFETASGRWRGIADVPGGNLRLRDAFARLDARRRYRIDTGPLRAAASRRRTEACICGRILSGVATPADCPLFGTACVPERPVGACMVSTEGACRIWHQYGGRAEL
jgi:hydrogenase expression/formation protein HypD